MQQKIGQLFLWHTLVYLVFYDLRNVALDQSWNALLDWGIFSSGMLNLSSLICFFLFSLGAYLVSFHFYPKRKKELVIGIIIVLILVCCIRYALEEIIFLQLFGFDNFRDDIVGIQYVLNNIYFAFVHFSVGFIFFFIQYSNFKEQQRHALIIENQQTQLSFLRSQFNPHFLFNTLNNIYSLVYQKSEHALPAIEKLSAILRSSLYGKKEYIPLQEEIVTIQRFVELERMRFDYPIQFHLQQKGATADVQIPPFILFPFVENAFKHGDIKQLIEMTIQAKENELTIEISNAVAAKQKDKVGGIGLNNIKKRLNLMYGDQHKLRIEEKAAFFRVHLSIPLNDQR